MAFQRKKPAAVGIETLFPGFIDPALPTSIEKARQSDIARQRNALQVVRDVQIRLVQRQRLDDRRVFRKNLADLLRDRLADLEARLHEDQVRTLPLGSHRRHRRLDADLSGFVARRGRDFALVDPPTATGLPRRSGLTPDEVETWMMASPDEALKLQRPLPDGSLRIVARGVKEDLAGPAEQLMKYSPPVE